MLLCAALAALAPKPLAAQDAQAQANLMDMSLEDLMKVEIDSVYGASGFKQQVVDAPASITIITADEIKRYGYRNLADILRNVPGFYVTNDREFSYLGVRGFGPPGDFNSRVLLLLDGHWTNDNVTGGAVFGSEMPFDIDLIERVEVIRGPNSSIYVASALLAIVNVVTKRGRDCKGLTVSEELASYRTYKSRLTYGRQFKNGLDVLLSGSYDYSHGPDQLYFKEFNNPATNYGLAENANGGRWSGEFAKLSYRGLRLEGASLACRAGDGGRASLPASPSAGRSLRRGQDRRRFPSTSPAGLRVVSRTTACLGTVAHRGPPDCNAAIQGLQKTALDGKWAVPRIAA